MPLELFVPGIDHDEEQIMSAFVIQNVVVYHGWNFGLKEPPEDENMVAWRGEDHFDSSWNDTQEHVL